MAEADSGQVNVVYVAYNSAFDPLVESQVIAYLAELHRTHSVGFRLITFEPQDSSASADPAASVALEQRLRQAGIEWIPLRYHQHPSLLATGWDVMVGVLRLAREVRRRRPVFVHARSHVAAAMAALVQAAFGIPFVFDCRGLLADEYLDAGHWRRDSWKYRITKSAEGLLFQRAKYVVVLTERLRGMLAEGDGVPRVPAQKVAAIPCCVDLARFAPRSDPGPGAPFTLCYLGSVRRYLLAEMLEFAAVARDVIPGFRFLIVNRDEQAGITAEIERQGLGDTCRVQAASPEQVPALLQQATAGIVFAAPSLSKQATSPVKIGEYLAAGLPVVVNAGLGDTEHLVRQVGVVVPGLTREAYREAALELRALIENHEAVAAACRKRAQDELSLELGAQRYGELYRALCCPGAKSPGSC